MLLSRIKIFHTEVESTINVQKAVLIYPTVSTYTVLFQISNRIYFHQMQVHFLLLSTPLLLISQVHICPLIVSPSSGTLSGHFLKTFDMYLCLCEP